MAQFDSSDALLVQETTPTASQKESFLNLCLKEGISALVPLQNSAEVLTISRKDIVPLFFMPAWVTGVYNLRGEILWIVDLPQLLNLSPCYSQESRLNFTVLVLQVTQANSATGRTQRLGCIVQQLESIEYCNNNDFRDDSPSTIKYSLPSTFLQGYWQKSNSESLAILNIKAIFQSLSQIS